MATSHPEPETVYTLDELGIEQVDEGLVEDTFENRSLLRRNGYYWTHVWDYYEDEDPNEGEKPHLLQVYNLEQRRAQSLAKIERRSELLENPDNPWSEYVNPLELLADAPAPWWVKRSAKKWLEAVDRGWDPLEHGQWLPERCKVIKRDGTRCQAWSGTTKLSHHLQLCRMHLGQRPEDRTELYVRAARHKIMESSLAAADQLEALLDAELETVRLRAATEILDRGGIRAGSEVSGEITVTHVDATALVRDRLDKLRAARLERMNPAAVIEGEVVGDDGERAGDA